MVLWYALLEDSRLIRPLWTVVVFLRPQVMAHPLLSPSYVREEVLLELLVRAVNRPKLELVPMYFED